MMASVEPIDGLILAQGPEKIRNQVQMCGSQLTHSCQREGRALLWVIQAWVQVRVPVVSDVCCQDLIRVLSRCYQET